jgi:hypothetical protein
MSKGVRASLNDDFIGLLMRGRRKPQIAYLYPECVYLSWDSSSPDPSLASCLGVWHALTRTEAWTGPDMYRRHFGAEIIKVEPPNAGDPLRVWRELDVDGTSPWFRSLARNKKSVSIDMRKEEGRVYVFLCDQTKNIYKKKKKKNLLLSTVQPRTATGRPLRRGYRELQAREYVPSPFSLTPSIAADMQYVISSPVALEKWGLGPDVLRATNPGLIVTRVSGYGQTGPWSGRPGYASVCEGEAGFRFINGFPDERTGELSGPPVRPNISLGDSVAGLTAAFGTVLALLARRARQKDKGVTEGLTVDVSIMER